MGGHPEILLLAFADWDVDASFEDDLHDAIAALAAEPRDWVLGAPALVDETDHETGVRTIGAVLRLHAARDATGRLLDATLDRRELDDARAFVAALQPVSARHAVPIGFELDGDSVGWIEAGAVGDGLREGLLGSWGRRFTP